MSSLRARPAAARGWPENGRGRRTARRPSGPGSRSCASCSARRTSPARRHAPSAPLWRSPARSPPSSPRPMVRRRPRWRRRRRASACSTPSPPCSAGARATGRSSSCSTTSTRPIRPPSRSSSSRSARWREAASSSSAPRATSRPACRRRSPPSWHGSRARAATWPWRASARARWRRGSTRPAATARTTADWPTSSTSEPRETRCSWSRPTASSGRIRAAGPPPCRTASATSSPRDCAPCRTAAGAYSKEPPRSANPLRMTLSSVRPSRSSTPSGEAFHSS